MKYLCYDSALNETYTLVKLMQRYPKHTNLFQGTVDERLWDTAPWLFELNSNPYELKGQMFISLDHSIVFESKKTVKGILDYMQGRMIVNENSRSKYLKIWDARILLKEIQAWPTLDLEDFFGVFSAFYTESDEDDYLYKWTWTGSGGVSSEKSLKTEALPIVKSDEEIDREYEESLTPKQAQQAEVTKQTSVKEDDLNVQPGGQGPKRRRFLTD